jgi:riboflavin kinase/FMN adenylyltransferase
VLTISPLTLLSLQLLPFPRLTPSTFHLLPFSFSLLFPHALHLTPFTFLTLHLLPYTSLLLPFSPYTFYHTPYTFYRTPSSALPQLFIPSPLSMKLYYQINDLPAFHRAVVTIGTFDGVHLGHRQILQQLKQEANRIQGETVLITFHPHPRKIVSDQKTPIQLLNTPEEKIALLAAQGIDHLVIVPFTPAFAQQTADEYVEQFLWQRFRPHTLIIGYDHRFGKDRTGDYHLLEAYAEKLGFTLVEIPAHIINEATVSSTRIRQALLNGDIAAANELLGYDYFFEGLVAEGNKLGTTIGYPTANLQPLQEEKLIPGNGVYAVTASIVNEAPGIADGESATISSTTTSLNGMMNIGIRPTIGGSTRVIEVNLFDFNENIYGKTLRVFMKAWLRPEIKFNGLDALKTQLAQDKKDAMQALAATKQ